MDKTEWIWNHNGYNGTLRAGITLHCSECDKEFLVNTVADSITSAITTAPTADSDGMLTYTASYNYRGTVFTNSDYTETIPKTTNNIFIGAVGYAYLEDALEAAKSGDVITLIADIDEAGKTFYDNNNKSVTIDLNGHTAVFGSLNIGGDLTVKNGTFTCDIGNENVGNNNTLTLDNAVLNAANGIQWYAMHIALTNGSTLNLGGGSFLGDGSDDGFDLIIVDGTSKIIMDNCNVSGYNESRVKEEVGKYLPAGYSFDSEGYVVDKNGDRVTETVELVAANFVLTKVEAKAATCEENGYKEHYEDTHGKFYADADGTQKLSEQDVVMPATGHSWGKAIYSWLPDYSKCTKSYICQNDPSHKLSETATAVISDGIATAEFTKLGNKTVKYAHSDNVDDSGEQLEQYGNNLSERKTVTIEGAAKLNVKIKYGTESGYDFVKIYKADGQTEVTAALTGTGETEFEVEGNTVIFELTSDYSGYFATVSTTLPDIQTAEVKSLLIGDVNFDGTINDKDTALVLKYISTGKAFFEDNAMNELAKQAANIDGIGDIDMLDVIKIMGNYSQLGE